MSDFFDNMCRTLATPMSRSSALKLIAGGLAGTVLAPFGFGQNGNGQGNNGNGQGNNGNGQGNNGNGQGNNGNGNGGGRCEQGSTCVGANQDCCPPGQTCFGGGTSNVICCGGPLIGAICTNKSRGQSGVTCVQPDASGHVPSGCTAI